MGSISMDQFVLQTIESLMNIERNEFLNSCSGDKGNGSYTRAFQSLSKNGLVIKVPRTRSGDFSPDTLELLKINQQQLDDICLSLYKKGLSGADISHFISECFGEKTSPSKISQLVKLFHQFRTAWQNAPLENHYKVVFGDVIFITVRRDDSYTKEGVYVLYGVRQDNKRELLALETNPTEGSVFWGEILQTLKNRNVEKIDLFIAEDLKEVFNNFDPNSTLAKAKEKVAKFIEKWRIKYPTIKRYFDENTIDYYFTYINYDPRVRRLIYTSTRRERATRTHTSTERYEKPPKTNYPSKAPTAYSITPSWL